MRISLQVHLIVLALSALAVLFVATQPSDSRVANQFARSLWIAWGLYAVLSSAAFPLIRGSRLRYVISSLALVLVSALLVVALVLGGLWRTA